MRTDPAAALVLILLAGVMLALVGCDQAAQPTTTRPSASAAPAETPPGESAQFYAIALVQAEAAKRMGIPVADAHVEKSEARNWPDASLGCPKPDTSYAQVVTPGFLMEVTAAGKTLEYHTDLGANQIILCAER